MGPFEILSDGSAIPVLAFKLKDSSKYTVFHVSEKLREGGWQVPAYTLPDNATDTAILRVVVREDSTEILRIHSSNRSRRHVLTLTSSHHRTKPKPLRLPTSSG